MKIRDKNIKNKIDLSEYKSKINLIYSNIIINDTYDPLNIESGEYTLLFTNYERDLIKRLYDYILLSDHTINETKCFILSMNLVIISSILNLNPFSILDLLKED